MIRAETRLIHRDPINPLRILRRWAALARQRKALSALDDEALRDIGLTRDAADAESGRPFWDAPDNWRF